MDGRGHCKALGASRSERAGYFTTLAQPARHDGVKLPDIPCMAAETARRFRCAAVGEHTVDVLSRLGYTDSRIADLLGSRGAFEALPG